jgi:monoamine oxidase
VVARQSYVGLTACVPQKDDVVVIGAGFAGLTAARDLVRRGYRVTLLEGRSRVGGRSYTQTIAGLPVDVGAMFVGPTQDALIALAAELGCATIPTYHRGKNLINWRGKVRSYSGTIPALSVSGLLNMAWVRWRFARVARAVSVSEPWNSRRCAALDTKSLDQWLTSVGASRSSKDLMAIMARVSWGAEAENLSMLHVARYVKAAGGMDRMLDVTDGAQQDWFPAGTQQIACRMAEQLGERVLLGAAVSRIEHSSNGVVVTHATGSVAARAAVVATAPAHREAITFSPSLPREYERVQRGWPQGDLTKVYVAYRTPFWREDGHSGESLSDTGPLFITFDVTPDSEGPGVLVGFVNPRQVAAPKDLQSQVLAVLAELFGAAALRPIDYVAFSWSADAFAPGGPTAAVPPGWWTEAGAWLRLPVGPVHWAGTETADEWTGFLEGAIRSGRRAAEEVAAVLR